MKQLNMPALLSFFCGFVSLSLEILWVRMYSFAHLSTPKAFGFVLMAYLIGIAAGAYWGGRACMGAASATKLWEKSFAALALSSIANLFLPIAFAWLIQLEFRNPAIDLIIIAASSGILAFIFPIAHHLGTGNDSGGQGRRFATVYTANVLGAFLGPLVTGYILLDLLTLQQCFLLLSVALLLASLLLLWWQSLPLSRGLFSMIGIASMTIMVGLYVLPSHELIQRVGPHEGGVRNIIENRHGVIALYSGSGEDIVYGGNVYDGRTNLDPEKNSNGLHRPLLLTVLHPEPKKVLMIGLSIGTWLALINGFPGVEKVDVVEINPGYATAASAYAPQARALEDPRVNLISGDGRRWLRLNQDEKYDLIVMNTTWHWRANISLLLSQDFFKILAKHMQDDAILAFNATGSGDAFFTASTVFPHAYRYDNFVYASRQDFRLRKDGPHAVDRYGRLKVDGDLYFKNNSPAIKKIS